MLKDTKQDADSASLLRCHFCAPVRCNLQTSKNIETYERKFPVFVLSDTHAVYNHDFIEGSILKEPQVF